MLNLFRILLVFLSCGLLAEESFPSEWEKMFPKSDMKFRINDLWPSDYIARLMIDPAIPSNFVLKSFPQDDFPGYFAWGPKEVFEECNWQDRKSLTKSILIFHISMNVAQTGPKSFSGGKDDEKQLKEAGFKNITKKMYMWGDYPVQHMGGVAQGKKCFSAWIGCNYESFVIFSFLAYPFKEGRPNEDDEKLWTTFLTQTKALSVKDAVLASGWDLHPGYTWMDELGVTLLAVAERRKRDNMVQVIVSRKDDVTSIAPSEIRCGIAGGPFMGKEIVKVHGRISKKFKEGGSLELISSVINVLVKTVDEFSLDKETLGDNPKVFVYQGDLKVDGEVVKVKGET